MKNLLNLASITVIAFTLQFVSTDAHANFIGIDLTIEWHFSNLGSVIATETNTVGGGIEFAERFNGPNIDVGATTIDFFGANGSNLASGSFNGFVFTDTTNSIDDFLGISISSQTGYLGFEFGDINVTANRIEVNFESVSAMNQPDGQVQLTVRFSSVPEPGTLALLGIGLVGMAIARRRKKV